MYFHSRELLLILLMLELQKKEKKYWVHPIHFLRGRAGNHVIIDEKYKHYPDKFKKETRFTPDQFDVLLHLLSPHIQKQTSRRGCISPRIRLYVTLRFLGHGVSLQQLSNSFCLGHSTVCEIVNETTRIIWQVLQPIYLSPSTKREWEEIATDFDKYWNFPNCIGALDGKHVIIQKPHNSGSIFYNYKKSFSINLMAICDAHYRFTLIDVGGLGRQNDSGVFRKSNFGKKLINGGDLKIPLAKCLPNSLLEVPHFVVADDAFPLTEHILKPFPGTTGEPHKRIFNYRLSRARRTIENAFGILASRFRIFRNAIIAKPEIVDYIVKAACVLHNFLRTWDVDEKSNHYFHPRTLDREDDNGNIVKGDWRRRKSQGLVDMGRVGKNNYSQLQETVRENIALYFVGTYPLPWQNQHITTASWDPVII